MVCYQDQYPKTPTSPGMLLNSHNRLVSRVIDFSYKVVIPTGAKRSGGTCCFFRRSRQLTHGNTLNISDSGDSKLSHKPVVLSEATDVTRRRSGSHALARSLNHIHEIASSNQRLCEVTLRDWETEKRRDSHTGIFCLRGRAPIRMFRS